jgi:HK97 family phage major capsid protein
MLLTELREKNSKCIADMRAIIELSETQGRQGKLTPEEEQQYDRICDEQTELDKQIERRQRVEEAEKKLNKSITPGAPPALESRTGRGFSEAERREKEMRVFERWVRYGYGELEPEERQFMNQRRYEFRVGELPSEIRAQAVGTGAAGGYTVPQGFSQELEKSLKAFGGMRAVCRLFPTPAGNDIPWPTVDDTSNVGELLAENTGAAAQDVTFGQITLKAYKYSSKIVLVSRELLQDSFFDIGVILRDLLTERIGRITNTHFTTGDNSGKPQGIVTASVQGRVGTTGQTTSIIADDLVELEHSVDPLYRPGSMWMMADSSLKVVKKLKDTTGRFLWQPQTGASIEGGSVSFNSILGYPYQINQDVPAMAANAKSVLFGDFQKYVIRDILDVQLLRLEERYAELAQVGFIAFMRADGRAINTAAIKHYANSAT